MNQTVWVLTTDGDVKESTHLRPKDRVKWWAREGPGENWQECVNGSIPPHAFQPRPIVISSDNKQL
jgi:hypothetical protein